MKRLSAISSTSLIETEVLQENHAMQQLNEGSGFKASGMRFNETESRIIYRKFKAE
jgi:glutathionylspermidine synthase